MWVRMSDIFDGLQKCLNCNKAIPSFSIEWSDLPDDQKCKCAKPGLPSFPFEPISFLLGVLLGNVVPPLENFVRPFGVGTSPEKIRKARRKAGRRNPYHPSARARQKRRPDKRKPKTKR